MKNISFVIPHLNENNTIFEHTLNVLLNSSNILGIQCEILIFDGGSDEELFSKMKKTVEEFKNEDIKLYFPFPFIRQNKNLIIKCCSKIVSNDIIFIIDSDIINLSEEMIIGLYNTLQENDYYALFPQFEYLYGRDNYLIGNPILRLFFPEISKQTISPLPGFLVIKRETLKALTCQNYFVDWGGEIQNIIDCFFITKRKIAFPFIGMKQEKHRKLFSKIIDSYQIYRAGFALASKYDKINSKINDTFEHHIKLFSNEYSSLIDFLGIDNYSRIITLFKSFEIDTTIEHFLYLYNKTNNYEYILFVEMVILPINFILFKNQYTINLPNSIEEERKINLKSVSFLCDLFILCMLKQNKDSVINKDYIDWMFCISPFYTDMRIELNHLEDIKLDISQLSTNNIGAILNSYQSLNSNNILDINNKAKELMYEEND